MTMKSKTKCWSFASYFFIAILFFLSCTFVSGQESKETVSDVEGNVYRTVKIGTQTWMAENLKVTRYPNGEKIQEVTNRDSWVSCNSAYCWYNNDTFFKNTYGALYNYYALSTIAPKGWHIPTVEEWETLIDFLGGAEKAGAKLKEAGTDHWSSSNAETTNENNFTALPAGERIIGINSSNFIQLNEQAWFWTSTDKNAFKSWSYLIKAGSNEILKVPWNTNAGLSVRCIKN